MALLGRAMSDKEVPLVAYRLMEHAPDIVVACGDRHWMNATANRFANRCLPLRMANQAGWFILNPCEADVIWHGGDSTESMEIRHIDGEPTCGPVSHFGHGVLTWQIPYLFRTATGYNLVVRGPTNWAKDGASPLDAIMEADWMVTSFTMNWRLTRPGATIRFGAGEPICMLFPQRRNELEQVRPEIRPVSEDPELYANFQTWKASRLEFNEKLQRSTGRRDGSSWEKHYFLGIGPSGERFSGHQVKLALSSFHTTQDPKPSPAFDKDVGGAVTSSSPATRHGSVVVGDFFTGASRMKECFDRFSADCAIGLAGWRYACDHCGSECLHAEGGRIFDSETLASFAGCLRRWFLEELGLPEVDVSLVTLLVNHGTRVPQRTTRADALSFFFSLTDWQNRGFSGGEIIVESGDEIAVPGGSTIIRYHSVVPAFNHLIVVDPKRIHGIRQLHGLVPQERGEVLLEGSARAGIHIDGPLSLGGAEDALGQLAADLQSMCARELEEVFGFATFRMLLKSDGTIEGATLLANYIVSRSGGGHAERLIVTACDCLRKMRFPATVADATITFPLICVPRQEAHQAVAN